MVLSYAVPTCVLWALAYAVPWWGWLLVVVAVLAVAKKAAELAALVSGGAGEGHCHDGDERRSGGGSGGARGRYDDRLTSDGVCMCGRLFCFFPSMCTEFFGFGWEFPTRMTIALGTWGWWRCPLGLCWMGSQKGKCGFTPVLEKSWGFRA